MGFNGDVWDDYMEYLRESSEPEEKIKRIKMLPEKIRDQYLTDFEFLST
jgi:hypothetical protein